MLLGLVTSINLDVLYRLIAMLILLSELTAIVIRGMPVTLIAMTPNDPELSTQI